MVKPAREGVWGMHNPQISRENEKKKLYQRRLLVKGHLRNTVKCNIRPDSNISNNLQQIPIAALLPRGR